MKKKYAPHIKHEPYDPYLPSNSCHFVIDDYPYDYETELDYNAIIACFDEEYRTRIGRNHLQFVVDSCPSGNHVIYFAESHNAYRKACQRYIIDEDDVDNYIWRSLCAIECYDMDLLCYKMCALGLWKTDDDLKHIYDIYTAFKFHEYEYITDTSPDYKGMFYSIIYGQLESLTYVINKYADQLGLEERNII